MKQIHTWQFIKSNLEKGIPSLLMYVLESKGSSPGRQGFFMAVNAENEMQGSIGGGIMEHKFVELAKKKLKDKDDQTLVRKQIHSKSATTNQSGMICSGEQTILLYTVTNEDQESISKIIECLERNKNGTLELSPQRINFSETISDAEFNFQFKNESDWSYQERLGYRNHLYIVGGGHCALALSDLMRNLDFYIHVFEERNNLNTFDQNNSAHKKTIVPGYDELKELIPPGNNHYVVLMTFGYRTDAAALRAIIGKELKYIGMLGSKEKIRQLFEELKTEGISQERINGIHSPVGIDIKSETPEEIAVSIAAEIIRIKNHPLS